MTEQYTAVPGTSVRQLLKVMWTNAHDASVHLGPPNRPVSHGGRPVAASSLQAAPLEATTDGGGGGSVVAELVAVTGPRARLGSDSVTVTVSVSW